MYIYIYIFTGVPSVRMRLPWGGAKRATITQNQNRILTLFLTVYTVYMYNILYIYIHYIYIYIHVYTMYIYIYTHFGLVWVNIGTPMDPDHAPCHATVLLQSAFQVDIHSDMQDMFLDPLW